MLPKSNMLESIMNVVETLPPEKQREVLDFVEFLQGQLTCLLYTSDAADE